MKNDIKDILSQTANGLNIFAYYFGKDNIKKKRFINPFRGDTVPSCHIYKRERNGDKYWYFIDFGDSDWRGDCFAIVGKIKNINPSINFPAILEKIKSEISVYSSSTYTPDVTPSEVEKKIVSYSIIETSDFTYFRQYGIKEEILSLYGVKSLSRIDITNNKGEQYSYSGTPYYPMFAYTFPTGGMKIYSPLSYPKFLYVGKLPSPYIFGYNQLPEQGEVVVITGGEKDVLSLASHGFPAICFNSETFHIGEKAIENLSHRFDNIYIMYDSDATGDKESSKIESRYRDRYGVRKILLPLPGTKLSKDVSDYFRMGHTSQELASLIQNT